MTCRCRDCDVSFPSNQDTDQCPRCAALEARALACAAAATLPEAPPLRRYSRAWNREYLGVTGNVDE